MKRAILRSCVRCRALNLHGNRLLTSAPTRSRNFAASSSLSGGGSSSSHDRHDPQPPERNENGAAPPDDRDSARKDIASPQQIRLDHAYCVNLVRERDREGYLCGLLMPAHTQKAFFAVRAFNVELASIKDGSNARRRSSGAAGGTTSTDGSAFSSSSSSLALQLRMQWWRDALETIYGDANGVGPGSSSRPGSSSFAQSLSVSCWHSPTVRSLFRAVREKNLTRRFLERLVDARESDLETNQPETVQQMVDYAEETSSSLLYLALECSHVRDDAADATASAAGVGIGLTTCLRATPVRLLHGEVPLAAELFPRRFDHRTILTELEEWQDVPGATRGSGAPKYGSESALVWQEAARHVAHEATHHLRRAQEAQRNVPRGGRACLLPVVPALHYLSQLEGAQHHVWDPDLLQPTPRSRLSLLLRMGRTWLTGVL